jgi:hypothetical protein
MTKLEMVTEIFKDTKYEKNLKVYAVNKKEDIETCLTYFYKHRDENLRLTVHFLHTVLFIEFER